MDETTIRILSPIGNRGGLPWIQLIIEKAITGQRSTSPSVEDTVKLSPEAIAFSRADLQSSLRNAQINDIRAEIKAGTFLTPERLAGTVESLLEVFG